MKELPTISVHGDESIDHPLQALSVPIFQSSAFAFNNFAEMRAYAQGKTDRYIYSRYANPTTDEAEKRLAALEGAPSAIATASGMAATFVAIMTTLTAGDELIALDAIYGGTYKLFRDILPRFGISARFISSAELNNLSAYCSDKSRLLWLETPTNPINRLIDLAAISASAHQQALLVAVDNTFASPINQRPLQLGADIVVHSATKYLGGHDDLTAGFIAANDEFIKRARALHILLGATLDPHAAGLLIRGMQTLDLRMRRINANSVALASWLAGAPPVEAVHYPWLESHPQFQLARRQMQGGGGIIAIELANQEAAARFIDGLKMIRLAPTLGGVETLVSYPLYTSHAGLDQLELERAGVSDKTVRFAVGIEAIDDIIGDVAQALRNISA
jgi:cystathionine beta-lyase/cystathionine gamma-synthase